MPAPSLSPSGRGVCWQAERRRGFGGTSATISLALQRLARERHGRDTQALQVLYAIEGFLRRLSRSDHRERLVLKGAMLLAALDARRTTKDADLSAHGIPNDLESITGVVASIAAIALPAPDGEWA